MINIKNIIFFDITPKLIQQEQAAQRLQRLLSALRLPVVLSPLLCYAEKNKPC